MNRKILWIAAAAFIIPILARLVWFYPGFTIRPEVATPDYQNLSIPVPPFETPEGDSEVSVQGGVVVVDAYHGNLFQPSEIEPLTTMLAERGARLEYDDSAGMLETRLKYARAYVVISPNTAFSPDEARAVQAFVARGGRLAVFTDATRGQLAMDYFTGTTTNYPDVNAANPLLASFDISINNDYLYNLTENEGNFRNVYFDGFGKHELAFGLQRVAFYGTHSVQSGSGQILLRGTDQTFSSLTDAPLPTAGGAALSADGNVLVFGDFTFLTIPYSGVADNRTLIGNIADYLLGASRQDSLADFPYIFDSGSLNVLPSSDVQMTAEMIGALSRLQAALRPANVTVQIADDAPAEGNLLVLGTFAPAEDLAEFTDPFDILLDEFAGFVETPAFGKVGRLGNGLLLFEPGARGNTLVLLADTSQDLGALLDALTSGSMSGCLIQENTGVCSIGFGGNFSDGSGFDFELPTGEFSPDEFFPTPAATPTPIAPSGG
jgi:hypothetical protein